MRPAILLVALALAGCIGNIDAHSRVNIAPQGTGNVDEMRVDLKACLQEGIAFELIPDFGGTAERHRMKCMRQRGWVADVYRGKSIPDFSRATTPAWATGD
jgi:hypothetical protein